MTTDTRKLAIGVLVVLVSAVLALSTGGIGPALPPVTAAVAALGLAAGALLIGTADEGRPV